MQQKRSVRFFNTTGPCNPWDERIYWQEEAVPSGTVRVLGC